MDVISRRTSSSLNPNAPLFIPWAYQAVEDFSDQWWQLVKTSPWFRDYWLQECFHDPQNDLDFPLNDDTVIADIESVFDGRDQQNDEGRDYNKDLISLGALKWRKSRVLAETPKFVEKAPKFVNVKINPRPIQQPR